MADLAKTKDKLQELCRLLHDGNIQIMIHDKGHGLRILWNDSFVTTKRNETKRIQELVYKDEHFTGKIAKLPDGLYGATQLWNFFTANHKA